MSTISASTTSTTAYKVTADTTGTLVLQTGASPTTAVTIDGSQNVGIGTSSPASNAKLTVAGNLYLSNNTIVGSPTGSTTGTVTLNGGNTFAGGGGAGMALRGYTAGYNNGGMEFYYGNGSATIEAMRIDSSGNLLVGAATTDPIGARANGTAIGPSVSSGSGLQVRGTAGAIKFGLNSTSGSNIQFFTDNGSTYVSAGNISSNGAITTYNATSDYRLKNNIQPLTNALTRVAALRPVKWTWKEGYGGTQPECEGFIAHELQEVVSVAVTGKKDAVDTEGNPVYQGIDTSFLVATLTAAIQEQQAIIQQLTARIETLEAK